MPLVLMLYVFFASLIARVVVQPSETHQFLQNLQIASPTSSNLALGVLFRAVLAFRLLPPSSAFFMVVRLRCRGSFRKIS